MRDDVFTLIDDGEARELRARSSDGRTVRVPPDEMRAALGWTLEPQGLCRGEHCLPAALHPGLVTDDGIDLARFAAAAGRALALDADERVAVLGASAGARAARLDSLEAPDFTLPDLAGTPHTLSGFRGKKVLLLAWASW